MLWGVTELGSGPTASIELAPSSIRAEADGAVSCFPAQEPVYHFTEFSFIFPIPGTGSKFFKALLCPSALGRGVSACSGSLHPLRQIVLMGTQSWLGTLSISPALHAGGLGHNHLQCQTQKTSLRPTVTKCCPPGRD